MVLFFSICVQFRIQCLFANINFNMPGWPGWMCLSQYLYFSNFVYPQENKRPHFSYSTINSVANEEANIWKTRVNADQFIWTLRLDWRSSTGFIVYALCYAGEFIWQDNVRKKQNKSCTVLKMSVDLRLFVSVISICDSAHPITSQELELFFPSVGQLLRPDSAHCSVEKNEPLHTIANWAERKNG